MARFSALIILLVALVPAMPAEPAPITAETAPACPNITHVQDIGLACKQDGILATYGDDGRFLGWTHGPDPVPAMPHPNLPGHLPKEPVCVNSAIPPDAAPRAVVIYARAFDDLDGFAAKTPTLRNMVAGANNYVYNAGLATGTATAIKVACDGGTIRVDQAVLPTPMAHANFNTIVQDLQRLGYQDTAERYMVYYDDRGACRCGGTAHLILIDIPGPANPSNGILGPLFSVTFGYDSAFIMLHELGHNLGAVQNSAPHSTGAGHCTDGRDIMCYNDGGPNAHQYSRSNCGSNVWDCGYDDYFHTNPGPGSYLASHWNIGSRWNRFFVFEDTDPETLARGSVNQVIGLVN